MTVAERQAREIVARLIDNFLTERLRLFERSCPQPTEFGDSAIIELRKLRDQMRKEAHGD